MEGSGMLTDIVADLRDLLPRSVRVDVQHTHIRIQIGSGVLRLSGPEADALIRRLPAVPSRASVSMIEGMIPHPKRRIWRALARLRRAA